MRLLLFLSIALAIYGALYYSVAPAKKAAPPAAPQPQQSLGAVLRNLFWGLAIFCAIDGLIFHSGLYVSVLKKDSLPGTVAALVDAENGRAPAGDKNEVALLGDSRMWDAFSAKSADEQASATGLRFVHLAVPGGTPRIWYYLLREIDPRAARYRAIVLPIRYGESRGRESPDRLSDLAVGAPLLRYGDALEFARSFPEWPDQCRAFSACVFRGYAYRADVHDFLENPFSRLVQDKSAGKFLAKRYKYGGNRGDLRGVSHDPQTGSLFVPEHLAKLREPLERALRPRRASRAHVTYRRQWLDRILAHYATSSSTIIFLQLPRGPLGRGPAPDPGAMREFVRNERTFLLEPGLFTHLEKPELFGDTTHLNIKGRVIFTQVLTDEVMRLLRPAPE